MSITAARKTTSKPSAAPLFHGQSTAQAKTKDSDFVDSLLDLLCEQLPTLSQDRPRLKAAICHHFGGDRYYVAARVPKQGADDTAANVLALFNGRNAREVARKLGIGRASVYRYLKQAGGKKNSR
jgi:Mor family transcriptional regulator